MQQLQGYQVKPAMRSTVQKASHPSKAPHPPVSTGACVSVIAPAPDLLFSTAPSQELLRGARSGKLEQVKAALNNGADPVQIDSSRYSQNAFHYAAQSTPCGGDFTKLQRIVKTMIAGLTEAQAHDAVIARDYKTHTPIELAFVKQHIPTASAMLSATAHTFSSMEAGQLLQTIITNSDKYIGKGLLTIFVERFTLEEQRKKELLPCVDLLARQIDTPSLQRTYQDLNTRPAGFLMVNAEIQDRIATELKSRNASLFLGPDVLS